jgi:HD-GYP domain-containing protein (c-di-GMP phosphodiesterase class II)
MGMLGAALGLDERQRARLAQAGMFHDLGKLSVPTTTLTKPMALDELEWRMMRRHPELGAEALQNAGAPLELRLAALGHHERPDGSGYPRGLDRRRLDEISLISAICDVHAALTETRSYRGALDDHAALRLMQESRQFEPRLLALFRTALLDHLAKAPSTVTGAEAQAGG